MMQIQDPTQPASLYRPPGAERQSCSRYYQYGQRPCCLDSTTQYAGSGERAVTRVLKKIVSLYRAVLASRSSSRNQCGPYLPSSHKDVRSKVGVYCHSDMRVTETSDEGLMWKKKLISSAQKSIELSPNFASGPDFRDILLLISDRMACCPNLRVHILLSPSMLEKLDKELLVILKRKYGDRFQYVFSNPVLKTASLHTEENHTKMLIVDSKYFVIGGTSIAPTLAHENPPDLQHRRPFLERGMPLSSRDADVIGCGTDTATTLREQYFRLYQLLEMRTNKRPTVNRFFTDRGEAGTCTEFHDPSALFHRVKLKVVVGGPEHGKENPITNEYVKRIRKCQGNIILGTLFFHPTKKIAKALKAARQAGCSRHIWLITNGITRSSSLCMKFLVWVSRSRFHLADASYEYQGTSEDPGQLYHKKVGIFGTSHSIIGSYNLGKKSSQYDFEVALVIKDSAVTQKLAEGLEIDRQNSVEIAQDSKRSTFLRRATKPLRKLFCQFY